MDIALTRHRRYRSWPGAARATLMLVTLVASPALAQSDGGSGTVPDEWKFTLAPYLMLPWMDGKTALRGHEVEVNVGPSQIFDNLQFSAMGYFEARGAKWGIGVDAVYMALGTDVALTAMNTTRMHNKQRNKNRRSASNNSAQSASALNAL